MTKSKKINWKQVFVHFLGMLFFALAFQSFAYLTNLNLSELIRHSNNAEREIIRQEAGATTLNDLYFSIELARTIGFVLGFLVSILISRIRNWYWVNSTLSLIMILLLGFAGLLGWSSTNFLLLFPFRFLSGSSYYILIGIVLLAIGIILLLIKQPIELKDARSSRRGYA